MGLVKSSHPPYLFTTEQYDGLLAASLSATLISLLASFAGLLVHFLLLWYDHHRPDNENYDTTTKFGSKTPTPTTSTYNTVVKDTSSGTDKNNLNVIQYGRMTNHLDTSPVMKTHNHRRGSLEKSSSTGAMNRVSLRLIVLACISYNIYSVAQIAIIGITEKVLACRILAYFIICFDVMGSMCLGLVGFNLVLVFVVNVKHPERFEKYYYGVTLLISIFVFVPPLVLKAGKTIDNNDSCWYHFFFEGRVADPFNWIYYYSWLLFASVLAAVSSVIAIRKVILEKNNFAHTINMLNREETSYRRPGMYPIASSASTHFQRNTNHFITTPQQPQSSQTYPKMNTEKNADLFRRVAIRCICYALVPVLCKSWGIGIEIAIASGIVVNYPILVIDRFMACIMGFFVSCIYFSDPSVRMVWHDMMIDYKKRYVDQFYYVDITKVIQLERPPNNYYPSSNTRQQHNNQEEEMAETIERMQKAPNRISHRHPHGQRTIYTIMNFSSSTTNKRVKSNSVPDPVYIYDSALRRPMKYHPPSNMFHYLFSHRKPSFHEEVTSEKESSSHYNWFNCFLYPLQCVKRKEKNIRWVPMRRIDTALCRSQNNIIIDDTYSTDSQESDMSMRMSELLNENGYRGANQMDGKNASVNDYRSSKSRLVELYSHPKLAKFIYWVFVNLLFYRPPYYLRQKRVFERRKGKGKGKAKLQQQQQEFSGSNFPIDISSAESFSRRNEYASMTEGIDDDNDDDGNIMIGSSNNEEDDQSKHDNVIKGISPVRFPKGGSLVISSSPSSLSQREYDRSVPSEPKTTPLQQRAFEKNVNSITVSKHELNSYSPSSLPLLTQNNQSAEAFDKIQQPPLRPLLRPGSRNRTISSSLIKPNQEKESQMQKHITQDESVGRRSSSYPLSTAANIPGAASNSRLPSITMASPSSKQLVKMKSNSSHAFLDQKLPHKRLHEYPSYRRIPTIGHLIQSVSPVHSFMSVRRATASSFVQTPATRPSSLLSGSSSLETSPVAAASQSLSSSSLSSSSSSPLKQDRQGSTTSGEKIMKGILNGSKNIEEHNETCGKTKVKNDKALTVACINDYLGSSTLSCEETLTCQPYIQQQPFLIEGGGLSPPSKQHYAFIYFQGERIPPFNKLSTAVDKSPNINGQDHSNNTSDKALTKKKGHNVQAFPDSDKEILFSGVQTILLHIKNDMNIDDQTHIDNQQRKERDRIDFLVENWEAASALYQS